MFQFIGSFINQFNYNSELNDESEKFELIKREKSLNHSFYGEQITKLDATFSHCFTYILTIKPRSFMFERK